MEEIYENPELEVIELNGVNVIATSNEVPGEGLL